MPKPLPPTTIPAEHAEPALYSVADVARLLNVSISNVYALCSRRLISHHKIGGCIRITPEQLREYQARVLVPADPNADSAA